MRIIGGKLQVFVAGVAAVLTTAVTSSKMDESESAGGKPSTVAYQGSSDGITVDLTNNRPQSAASDATSAQPSTAQDMAGQGFVGAASFLDDHAAEWETQSSTFTPSYFKSVTAFAQQVSGAPALEKSAPLPPFGVEILKLKPWIGAAAVPLRIIGFFPGCAPSDLAAFILDEEKRIGWDKNYTMFHILPAHQNVALTSLAATIPTRSGANSNQSIRAASLCNAVLDSPLKSWLEAQETNWSWACHRVSSSLLSKLGVKPKFFAYERVAVANPGRMQHIVAYRSVTPSSKESILSNYYAETARVPHPEFVDVLLDFFNSNKMPNDDSVFMHHQTIALLPVSSVEPNALEKLVLDARTAPSVLSPEFVDSVLAASKPAPKSICGTLMLMTSVNETPIPAGVPRWAEKRIAHFFTSHAYEMLFTALPKQHRQVGGVGGH